MHSLPCLSEGKIRSRLHCHVMDNKVHSRSCPRLLLLCHTIVPKATKSIQTFCRTSHWSTILMISCYQAFMMSLYRLHRVGNKSYKASESFSYSFWVQCSGAFQNITSKVRAIYYTLYLLPLKEKNTVLDGPLWTLWVVSQSPGEWDKYSWEYCSDSFIKWFWRLSFLNWA